MNVNCSQNNPHLTICSESKAIRLIKSKERLYYDVIIFICDPIMSEECHEHNNILSMSFYDTNDITSENQTKIVSYVNILKTKKVKMQNVLFFCDGGFSRSPMSAIVFMKAIDFSENDCVGTINQIYKKSNMENILIFMKKIYN